MYTASAVQQPLNELSRAPVDPNSLTKSIGRKVPPRVMSMCNADPFTALLAELISGPLFPDLEVYVPPTGATASAVA